NRSLLELLDAFSSPDPTPGGGSASALAGALGAALLAMVAGLPKTRTNTPEERSTLDDVRRQLLKLRATLVELVDRDAAAYDLVVAAYKKPKTTDSEKAERKAAIAAALRAATDVPLETMKACAEVLGLGKTVAEHGNVSAASDIGVGLHLAMAGLTGGRLNVETNLSSLGDEAYARSLREQLLLMMVGAGADLQAGSRAAGLRGADSH
ncbi:MAG TPA: cyclodeaminase/cyclohydrolase family protein, partial [Vicinamibacterales bacterium]|nr:cyclodeaminase/cyclohydrolase family protein [Vicinamibacterales bacterium]